MNQNEKWNNAYELACKYRKHYGNLNVKAKFKTIDGINYDENGFALGSWLNHQKERYDTLPEDRKNKLERIGFDINKKKSKNNFEYWYNLVKAYNNHYGNLNVNLNFKTFDGVTYDEKGHCLGRWLQERRLNNDVTKEERKLLEELGLIFEKRVERTTLSWDDFYKLAVNYKNHYGNLEIPSNFKTFDGINYDKNGHNLGYWIFNQRRRIDFLSKEKQEKLYQINIRINETHNDMLWKRNYKMLKNYHNKHGHLNIPSSFKTLDGISYNEKGLNLYDWYYNQTINESLSQEKKDLLIELGISIKNPKKLLSWDEWYLLASNYNNHYGNLNIKKSFKTFDGVNYNENGYVLYSWIIRQRKEKDSLTEDQIDKLNRIGMRFNYIRKRTKTTILSWDEWYSMAKNYYEHYGNLRISATYRTFDGYTYNQDGYKLGLWIVNQRQNKDLSKDKIIKLNYIGMIWSVKKNMNTLIGLLNQYNIDHIINKGILKKSYIEVYSKIHFLIDNNIDITNNKGELNPIFYISTINLEALYNISVKEIIEKYYCNNKNKSK